MIVARRSSTRSARTARTSRRWRGSSAGSGRQPRERPEPDAFRQAPVAGSIDAERDPRHIEQSPKKTFATAADWPGWSRSGKTEQLALEALAAYAPRYAVLADAHTAGSPLRSAWRTWRSLSGTTAPPATEFGVPSRPSDHDARPLDDDAPSVWPVSSRRHGSCSTGPRLRRRRSSGRDRAAAAGTLPGSSRTSWTPIAPTPT